MDVACLLSWRTNKTNYFFVSLQAIATVLIFINIAMLWAFKDDSWVNVPWVDLAANINLFGSFVFIYFGIAAALKGTRFARPFGTHSLHSNNLVEILRDKS